MFPLETVIITRKKIALVIVLNQITRRILETIISSRMLVPRDIIRNITKKEKIQMLSMKMTRY